MLISKITAQEILDSRGMPTIEATVCLQDDSFGTASVPSGASTGTREAIELRDCNNNRYNGKGVQRNIALIQTEVSSALINMCAREQENIDKRLIALDNTPNKAYLGANTILAVSLATAKAAAQSLHLPLYQYLGGKTAYLMPIPYINVINGGMHASNGLNIQEFMLIPSSAHSLAQALEMSAKVITCLQNILLKKGLNISVGDEGGFAPELYETVQALDLLLQAIHEAGYESGKDFTFALDIAASALYKNDEYHLDRSTMNTDELIAYYKKLVQSYPITSLEDPIAEQDIAGWQEITREFRNICQAQNREPISLVGDDVFVTQTAMLRKGINKGFANTILIKPNQVGTLSETLQTISLAKEHNYGVLLSHRSGETEDTTIAHLAVATNCGRIKCGSLRRSERLAKYNELLRIERDLKENARYPQ